MKNKNGLSYIFMFAIVMIFSITSISAMLIDWGEGVINYYPDTLIKTKPGDEAENTLSWNCFSKWLNYSKHSR